MNKKLRKAALLALAVSFVAIFASSCATARGFGRDVGHVGEEIERAAR